MTDVEAHPGTVIGSGIRIKGTLSGDDPIDLAGALEGSSEVTGLYRVREGARVAGDIVAGNLVIEGQVSGRTLVAQKIEIGALARVHAHLRAGVVAIAEGAFFEGQVHMQGGQGPVPFKEKRKGR